MPILEGKDPELQGILRIAELMVVSARTAPKSGGADDIHTAIVYGEEKERLVNEMERLAEISKKEVPRRDARTVRKCDVVVLIGVKGTRKFVLNCGACGFPTCLEFEKAPRVKGEAFVGPTCAFKAIDLGIALGSAVKTAGLLNVDNRLMNTLGTAAKSLNYLPEASIITGIPLSVTGKSVFFDRPRE